jgi:WD40 repeat protein
MLGPECIPEEDLRAWLLGDLPELAVQRVSRHLESCPECEATVSRLDDLADPFLDSLQRALRRRGANRTIAPADSNPTAPEEYTPLEVTGPRPEHHRLSPPGYEILAELGRGGQSVVYKARQLRPERIVALKMLLSGPHAEARRRQRFLAEADAVARLHHPHIVQIYAVGWQDDQPFFALEYLEGGSLARYLKGQPQPPSEAAALVETLARAVYYAHTQGVVHRDLKPGNVLLQRKSQRRDDQAEQASGIAGPELGWQLSDFNPKISDFGLAKHQRPDLTSTGVILGTPAYMAPEQACGGGAGPPADIYALGGILYELVTGRPPFQGATPLDTLAQVQTQEPVAPSQLHSRTYRDLSTICLKCLRKEPAHRYASALDLAEDLARFTRGEPIRARAVGPAERTWRWACRKPTLAALIASVALLLLLTAGISLGAAIRLSHLAGLARQAERDATEKLFRSSLDEARALRLSGRSGQHYNGLRALRQAVASARALGLGPNELLEVRNEAIACLTKADLRIEQEWEGCPQGTNGLAFDTRYQRYARSQWDGTISLRRVADDMELLRIPATRADDLDSHVELLFGGADDQFLSAWYDSRPGRPLVVWELVHGEARQRLRVAHAEGICSFAPDGRSLVVGLPDKAVGVFDLAQAREVRRFRVGWPPFMCAVHPVGRLVAVSSKTGPGVELRDLSTGTLVRELRHEPGAHGGACNGLAWSSADATLAVAGMDFRIHLWDAATGVHKGTLSGHEWEVTRVSFSRSGEFLASWGYDRTTRIWNARTGRQLVSHPHYYSVGFSPDDRIALALVEGTRVRLCGVQAGQTCRSLYGLEGFIDSVAFNPDGRLLVGHSGSSLGIWDVTTRQLVGRLPMRRWFGHAFEPGALLTVEDGRLRRWPLRQDSNGKMTLGTARVFDSRLTADGIRSCWWLELPASAGSRLLVSTPRNELVLKPFDRPEEVTVLDANFPEASAVSVSPNGRWAAVGANGGSAGFRVYDLSTGRRVAEERTGEVNCTFSPDGQWLLTSTGNTAPGSATCTFRKVGTWEPVHSMPLNRTGAPPGQCFSPDGRLLALTKNLMEVTLIDMSTFRELATLLPREPMVLHPLAFNFDSSLLACGTGKDVIHLWDLRELRRLLAEMELDW